jgi:hypothetical protein
MSPASESLHGASSHTTSSADVFGNDLADVDVWGEDPAHDRPTDERVDRVIQEAINISGGLPGSHVNRPPRTPQNRRGKMHLELLQRQSQPQKNVFAKAQLRRSTGSESDVFFKGQTSPPKNLMDSHLPPMTPRMRVRKLGMHKVPPAAPTLPETPPKPRSLCVAEKRRQRKNDISSIMSLNLQHDEEEHAYPAFKSGDKAAEPFSFPVVDWKQQATRALDDHVKSRRSPMEKASKGHRVRRYSGGLAFDPHESASSRDETELPPPDAKAEEKADKSEGVENTSDNQRPRHRESSRSDRLDEHRRRRSGSASKKKHRRSSSRRNSSHHSTKGSEDPMPPKKGRPRDENREDEDMNDLQNHFKNMLGKQEQASPLSVNLRNSAHSSSTKSSRSSSLPRQNSATSETTLSSPLEEESRKLSSPRNKRRESKKSPSCSEKDASPETSTPKAVQKIKFRRNSVGAEDEPANKSTRSGKSKISRIGTIKSPNSSKSCKSKRRSSVGNVCPPSPGPKTITNEKPTSSRSDCPPSPAMRRRSVEHMQRNSRAESPAGRRQRNEHKDKTASGTPRASPRRKMQFMRNASRGADTVEVMRPSIPTLGL